MIKIILTFSVWNAIFIYSLPFISVSINFILFYEQLIFNVAGKSFIVILMSLMIPREYLNGLYD